MHKLSNNVVRNRRSLKHLISFNKSLLATSAYQKGNNGGWTDTSSVAYLPVFLSAGLLAALSLDNSTKADGPGKPLTTSDLAEMLRSKLRPFRESLKSDGLQIPVVTVRSLLYENRDGEQVATQVLDMTFSPENIDIVRLGTHLLNVLNPSTVNKTTNTQQVKRLCEFYSSKVESTISIISEDKKSSITVGKTIAPIKGTNKRGHTLSVAFFKDGGFTKYDVDTIVKGYIEAFASTKSGDKCFIAKKATDIDPSIKPPVYEFAQPPPPQQRIENGLDSVINDIFSSPQFGGWLNSGDRTGSDDFEDQLRLGVNNKNRDGAQPQPQQRLQQGDASGGAAVGVNDKEARIAAAIRQLESLGVEVFDKSLSSNEVLTWDSLAGYEHVKAHIQSTIVDALQFPDIYDSVANKTRVVYESNRPKAVLLEGPPGTGKTLTARILASQCDRPLVVLRLESIVSKWFGESEKKLSKILDACDALDGAIVFVDEVDSLAQNRESEGGIHEVSKRILSVLLQRIEGFHGKGRSVLVAATNRRQDLDSALLSRFDLIIPYALPDHNTRAEIFKRYAKQFDTSSTVHGQNKGGELSAYDALAAATDGLSCRAIKEVCEQAERACASRLVAQRRQALAKGQAATTTGADAASAQHKSSGGGLGSLFSFGSSNSSSGSKEQQDKATAANNTNVPLLSDYMQAAEYMNKSHSDLPGGVTAGGGNGQVGSI